VLSLLSCDQSSILSNQGIYNSKRGTKKETSCIPIARNNPYECFVIIQYFLFGHLVLLLSGLEI
jgi:hypothetical protein